MSHTVYAPTISPGQKWRQRFLEIKLSCSQWEGSACNHEGSSFFLFFGGRGEGFLFFGLWPLSKCIPIGFLSSSQSVPQEDPNSTTSGEVYLFLFCNQGPKRCFYLGVPNIPKINWWWANQNEFFPPLPPNEK
jgi:hypothetical protein